MGSKAKNDKKQHIQVFTRVRPMNSQEQRSQIVVDCPGIKEVLVKDKGQTKTFTFDRVFGPDSKQVDVYKIVVSPLITEVLQGYNCTVFAYGQTGTGKTYTMVGDKIKDSGKGWEEDPGCGIIPRTLSHLFDELKVRAEEFTVRVSFLELYNEELCDLLAPTENLRLYEDSMKKGSVIVSGLEERTVHNKDDVYSILEAGNVRRQTAQTLMNAQSSRSHTIFTITVHIKVTTPEGEDLIKTGKLNLVDLAGSENIGRSGAVDIRAREAGNINQSLLTLGRVITSLVERTPHVPYRESKLTRILQDSLGGRTKTSIIATISPAQLNLEETLSTLDYAHRARNITNKPEINQKTSKRALIKEYTEEIERLRRDLIAAREKHGVYLASENYNAMMAEIENLTKEVVTKINMVKVYEEEQAKQEDIMQCLNMHLSSTKTSLEKTEGKLKEKERICYQKQRQLEELSNQFIIIQKTADEAISDSHCLHDRLERSRMIHEHNQGLNAQFKTNLRTSLDEMKRWVQQLQLRGEEGTKEAITTVEGGATAWAEHREKLLHASTQHISTAVDTVHAALAMCDAQSEASQQMLRLLTDMVNVGQRNQSSAVESLVASLVVQSTKMNNEFNALRSQLESNAESLTKQVAASENIAEKVKDMFRMVERLPGAINQAVQKREAAQADKAAKVKALTKQRTEMSKQLVEMVAAELKRQDEACSLVEKEIEEMSEAEETRFLAEITEVVHEGAERAEPLVEEASSGVHNMKEVLAQLSTTTITQVVPKVDLLKTLELEHNMKTEVAMSAIAAAHTTHTASILSAVTTESTRVAAGLQDSQQQYHSVLHSLDALNTNMADQMCCHDNHVVEAKAQSNAQLQSLSSDLSAQCEKLFSAIHEQFKRTDHFEEGIQRDEKTGNTPQRKVFTFPKMLSTDLNKSRSSCEGDNSIISEKSVEFDDADDKENIVKPTQRKPLRVNNKLNSGNNRVSNEDVIVP